VNVNEIITWWKNHRNILFKGNIRGILGDTDVNNEILNTLKTKPNLFWYFNNGITIVCDSARKTIVGGSDRDFGEFHCVNLRIINGAQTVSTIGRFSEKNEGDIIDCYVPVRIISMEETPSGLTDEITKANNKQNKIENRDFVNFDPEQQRIKNELAIDGINYNIIRQYGLIKNETSFDLIEATTSLCCASDDVNLVVQLKREIGKIFESLEKTPYKKIFNPMISSWYIYNCVCLQRKIDIAIDKLSTSYKGREKSILIHGNRIISYIIFNRINKKDLDINNKSWTSKYTDNFFEQKVSESFLEIRREIDSKYSTYVISGFFKNFTKCTELIKSIMS